jgi:hypothetical protein
MTQTATIQNPAVTQNLPTSLTQILATPGSGGIIVSGLTICNKTGATVTYGLTCYNGSAHTYLAFTQNIGAFDTVTFGGDFFKAAITAGYSLYAIAGTANALDVACFSTLFV